MTVTLYDEAWDDRKSKYLADNVTGGCREEDYGGRGGGLGGRDDPSSRSEGVNR